MEVVILLVLVLGSIAVFRSSTRRMRRRVRRWEPPTNWKSRAPREPHARRERAIAPESNQRKFNDAADQLRIVMGAQFQKQRLMSFQEYGVFSVVEKHLQKCGPGFRIMAQPSMGEFLQSVDKDAYLSINSKRVDMLIIDTFGMPVVAIEHQGSGHHQGDAAARDAVKREALRKAGVEFLEIFDYHQPDDIRRLLSESIARNKPPASPHAIPPRQTTP